MVTNPSFPNILADCLEALERNERTLEQCLAEYPEHWDELYTLLTAVQQVRAAPEAPPSLDFRYDARARLLRRLPSRARRAQHHHRPPLDSLRRAWVGLIQSLRIRRMALQWSAILILVISLFGGGTLTYASSDSLPGEALYPVKLALEEVRLVVSFDSAAEVKLRMEFATTRLKETNTLIQQHREDEAGQTLQAYAEEVQSAMDALRYVPEAQTQTLAQQIDQTTLQHDQLLNAIAEQAPSEAQSALDQALAASVEIRHNASTQATQAPATGEAVNAAPTDAPGPMPTPRPTEGANSADAAADPTQPALPPPTVEPPQPTPVNDAPTAIPVTSEPAVEADPLQVATPVPTAIPTDSPTLTFTDVATITATASPTLDPATVTLSPTLLATAAPTETPAPADSATAEANVAPTETASPEATATPSSPTQQSQP